MTTPSVVLNKKPPPGGQGGLQILLGVNISFFCENKPHVKFKNSIYSYPVFYNKF